MAIAEHWGLRPTDFDIRDYGRALYIRGTHFFPVAVRRGSRWHHVVITGDEWPVDQTPPAEGRPHA